MSILRKSWIHIALIALVALVIYSNTFSVAFFADDMTNIVKNPAIKGFRYFLAPDLVHEMSSDLSLRDYFLSRYVGYLSFAVNYAVHATSVAGYHLVNLALHILNGIMVYLICVSLMRSSPRPGGSNEASSLAPLLAALLFVCHPLQTQAVTYITQRFAVLATFFYISAFYGYIGYTEASSPAKRRWLYCAALISSALAMKTKEIAFTLPAMLLAYDVFFREGATRAKIIRIIPFALTAMLVPYGLMSHKGIGINADNLSSTLNLSNINSFGRMEYLIDELRVMVTYLRLIAFPVGQNFYYDYPLYDSILSAPILLSLIGLTGLVSIGIFLFMQGAKNANRHFLVAAFGILWFFVALSIESSIVPQGSLIFEHRLYLPLVGMFIGIAALLDWRIIRLPASSVIIRAVIALALCALSIATYSRNILWSDPIAFSEDIVNKSPRKPLALFGLATTYDFEGHIDKAKNIYLTLIDSDTIFSASALNNLGVSAFNEGNIDEAIGYYRRSIYQRPDNPESHNNLGHAYIEQGQYDQAVIELDASLRINPFSADAHNNMGYAYYSMGRIDDAIREFNETLRLDPLHQDALENLEILNSKRTGGDR